MANANVEEIAEYCWNTGMERFDHQATNTSLPSCPIDPLKLAVAMFMTKVREIEGSRYWETVFGLNVAATLAELDTILDFSGSTLRAIGKSIYLEESASELTGRIAKGLSVLFLESQGCFWHANFVSTIATGAARPDYLAIDESGSIVYVESKGSQAVKPTYARSTDGLMNQVIPWLQDSARAGLSNLGWSVGTHFPAGEDVGIYARRAQRTDFLVLPSCQGLMKPMVEHYVRWLGVMGLGVHARALAAANSGLLGFMGADELLSGLPPVRRVQGSNKAYIFPVVASSRSGFHSAGAPAREMGWHRARMRFAGDDNVFFGIEEQMFLRVVHAALGGVFDIQWLTNDDRDGIGIDGVQQALMRDGTIALRAADMERMAGVAFVVLTARDQRQLIYTE